MSEGEDQLAPDVRAFVDSVTTLLCMYMPGHTKIQMLVGRNITATLEISGGPITREVIEDTLAHLAFYKKYFPKDGEASAELDSPEKIRDALIATLAEHRAELDKHELVVTG